MTRIPARRPISGAAVVAFVARYGTILVLAVMIIGLTIAAPGEFLTVSNLTNILSQNSLTAVIAAGLTLPLLVGQFDLSIGYQASLSGILCVGLIVNQGLPIAAAIAVCCLVGVAVGTVNGLLVTKLRVNALVATLGVGTMLVGVNYAYSGGIPISGLDAHPAFAQITLGSVLGVPNPIVIMVVVLVVLWILVNKTILGQYLQAVGGNPTAALLSGIRVDRVRIIAFVIAGVCAALTGVLLSSRTGSGQVNAGDSYLLTSFSAAFLGSAALRDGEFHIVGTFLGVLTVGVGFNGLSLLGQPIYTQYLFSGGLLILAVALSSVARRFSASGAAGSPAPEEEGEHDEPAAAVRGSST